jgi:hypothetical protein
MQKLSRMKLRSGDNAIPLMRIRIPVNHNNAEQDLGSIIFLPWGLLLAQRR